MSCVQRLLQVLTPLIRRRIRHHLERGRLQPVDLRFAAVTLKPGPAVVRPTSPVRIAVEGETGDELLQRDADALDDAGGALGGAKGVSEVGAVQGGRDVEEVIEAAVVNGAGEADGVAGEGEFGNEEGGALEVGGVEGRGARAGWGVKGGGDIVEHGLGGGREGLTDVAVEVGGSEDEGRGEAYALRKVFNTRTRGGEERTNTYFLRVVA